ncbi:cilia- and flagella-associated protein 69-like [Lampris incognitus]|uniref:cilia- and flagella-associated protein 69-like n=1 Tax=Lampris incognitus TaxID=2546036 RepID=UPI0024B4EEF4|nr:cilia- and flagella-associated protein 69-like [Lampris incognitus]
MHRRKPELRLSRPTVSTKDQHHNWVPAKCLDLSKVISLFEDPLTASLKERHLFVLKKLLRRCQNGYLLRELTDMAKILNICAEKTRDHPEYVSVLCEALAICRLPFLKEKASDELTYAYNTKEFLSHMGCLMRISNAEVRHQICDSIKSVYTSVAPKQLLDGPQPTSPGYKLQLLEKSGLAQTMVLALVLLKNQPNVKLQVLQTLQILSSASDVNCDLILNAQGAETICLHMNEPDPSGQVLFRSSEILWNLLERGCKDEVTSQLSNMECIVALKEAFIHQLLNGLGHHDLQLRNDLLVITTLIAENPKCPLMESLFAKQLILYVTFPELKSHNPLVRNLKLSYNNEDFEMKKLLLNLVVFMSKDLSAVELFKEGQVMLALLTLVKPRSSSSKGQAGARHWSSAQQKELQLQALATLLTVAPLMLEDYMTCQGNTCLLLLLDWCTEQDVYFGQGNSLHDTSGRGSKKAQMRYCVRVLRSMASLGNETINQDLCDQGIINQLLGIVMQMERSPEEEDSITLEIKSDIQLILSALCESDMHRKELFGSEGVEMAVHFLRMSPEKFFSGLGHSKLILSTVDCVWSCIVGCYTTEDYFLAKEGAYLLLDLLHSSPKRTHNIILATLLELCDNPKTLSHILTWRDNNGHTAPMLLLQLWRKEEEELRVSRDAHGRITDPRKPTLSCYQEEESSSRVSFPANRPSPAVIDVLENLRSKIYSIFCKLGFLELPGLSPKDYVTLSIVKRYLDFKVGEVWEEIRRELALDDVRPVTPDEEALDTISRIAEDTARRVVEEQGSFLEQQEKADISEEKLMYTEIKSRWKQQELTAKSWDHYVSKTSDYKVLQEIKSQRERLMKSSTTRTEEGDARFHPSENYFGRVLAIKSTATHQNGGSLADMEVTLERVPIRGAALEDVSPSAQDPEYFSTVLRQVSGEVRMQPQSSFIDPVAMTMATVGMGVSFYSARQMAERVHLKQAAS